MTATQDATIAELQRTIAELRRERDAALVRETTLAEALARRNSEFGERIEHQAATIDVLKAMSASPGDPQPVFDLIVRRAQELCNVPSATLFQYDGERVHIRSDHRSDTILASSALAAYTQLFPIRPTRGSISCRAILDRQIIHIRDLRLDPELAGFASELGHRSQVSVPLIRDDLAIGVITIGAQAPGGFSDSQIELLKTFAEQAVIAISSAETYRDLHETLEQQTATAEVLGVINSSPGDLAPVFDAMLDKALDLCGAAFGILLTYDGELFQHAAFRSIPPAYVKFMREHAPIYAPESAPGRLALGERIVHLLDITDTDAYRSGDVNRRAIANLAGARTLVAVPLRKDSSLVGAIVVFRQEVRPFSGTQIALLQNFAAQAVIAMENARLLTEQREALEQQTATAEILQVINSSPGDVAPVFEAIVEKARAICGCTLGQLGTYDGEYFVNITMQGFPDWFVDRVRGQRYLQVPEVTRYLVDEALVRSVLGVPLRKEGRLVGFIAVWHPEVRPFSDKQIALLQNFAAQAVIAMENARLLDEIRQRQAELRITFENMGDGVAMFDEAPRLVAWNRHFQEMFNLPDDLLEQHHTYEEHLRFLAARGDFGSGRDTEEQLRALVTSANKPTVYERTRPDGRVLEIRRNPVPDGGFVLIFSDITERKRSEEEIRAARDAAEAAYRDLKAAQANLIQAEKMASLGQLTAGIAHEIKNPLNFVNNFAALSVDLLSELKETAAPGFAALTEEQRAEVEEASAMLTSNLEKITEHGRRADGIIKAMLEHSRASSGERRMVDLNALIDEALNLAYHGARAQDQSFNITLERDFGEGIAPIEVNPQDMTRVFLNIFSNGFYAATKRARAGGDAGFVPTLKVTTRGTGDTVEIRVRDNGTGIPADIRDKLFQPFFTTKPTGEGTGLGLSITYDIVTKAHGGSIAVDSKVGDYSEFTIRLPRYP